MRLPFYFRITQNLTYMTCIKVKGTSKKLQNRCKSLIIVPASKILRKEWFGSKLGDSRSRNPFLSALT